MKEIVLITYNSKTNKVTSEIIKDRQCEYIDKEILYGDSTITSIVCEEPSVSNINNYSRYLLKKIANETSKEIINLNKELLEANRLYLNVVNKLI